MEFGFRQISDPGIVALTTRGIGNKKGKKRHTANPQESEASYPSHLGNHGSFQESCCSESQSEGQPRAWPEFPHRSSLAVKNRLRFFVCGRGRSIIREDLTISRDGIDVLGKRFAVQLSRDLDCVGSYFRE